MFKLHQKDFQYWQMGSDWLIYGHWYQCIVTTCSSGCVTAWNRGAKTISSCQVTVWSPARLSLKWRQGYQASFSTVVCQGWCVRGLLETYKLEIFEANCGLVGCKGKIEFLVNWNETKVCVLGFCVGFVAARSFCAGIFRFSDRAFGNGVFSLGLFLCTLKTSKWTTR